MAGLALGAVGPRLHAEGILRESTSAPTREQVEAAVRSHLYEWIPLMDPLMTLENGAQIKSSNVKGIEIAGQRYFYRPRYGFSADPITRGRASDYQLVLLMDPGTQYETEVYRAIK